MKRAYLLTCFILLLAACAENEQPTPTVQPTETAVSAATAVSSPTPTHTASPQPTATATPTAVPTVTPSPTPVPQLAGMVTDAATGEGIADAVVEVVQVDSPGIVVSTQTAADGRYAFVDLAPATYAVRARAEGMAQEYFDNVTPSAAAEYITVAAGTSRTDVDFDLTPGGAISGQVLADDGETPVAGAEVRVAPAGHQKDFGLYTVTDENGRYRIAHLTLGEYTVRIRHPEFIRQYFGDVSSWPDAEPIQVKPSQTVTDIDFMLTRGGAISGFVYKSDGTPATGGVVGASGVTGEVAVEVKADGSYTLMNLAPGAYTVWAQSVAGHAFEVYDSHYDFSAVDQVLVEAGETTTGVNFTMDDGGLLRIIYLDAVTNEEIRNGQVTVYNVASGGDPEGFAGLWESDFWLAPGSYLVYANLGSIPGQYVSEWYQDAYSAEAATPVEIRAGETTEIEMVLAPAGSISGVVYAEDGESPVAGAAVYAFPDSGPFPGAGANADENGRYLIEGLAAGSYRVQVTAAGYAAQFYDGAAEEATAVLVPVAVSEETTGVDFVLASE